MAASPSQLRAARAMLGLSREQAAHAAGLHLETLRKAERGDPTLGTHSLEALVGAYTARGIVFIGRCAVERRASS